MVKLDFDNFLDLEGDDLEQFSRVHGLSFLPGETELVRDHMRAQLPRYRAEGIEVTPELIQASLEVAAQSFCEHSAHGTTNGRITLKDYSGPEVREVTYERLLWDTIMSATEELDKPWVKMAFKDDAGIIDFVTHKGRRWGFAGKCETHNYPSGVAPYGGAGTCTGGVIRDPLAVLADVRCDTFIPILPPPDAPIELVGKDRKPPRVYMAEINRGNQVYGNDMGIPTVLAASYFSRNNVNNPLVFGGSFGLVDLDYYEQTLREGVKPGDVVILVGGRTGRDGIHGATLSSVGRDTDEDTELVDAGVQIPNPIEEQSWSYFLVENLFRRRLVKYCQDFGGGGLSSAAFETAKKTGGVEIYIDNVRLKEEGMTRPEVIISESQERQLLAVDPSDVDDVVTVFTDHDIEAYPIGVLTDDGRAKVYDTDRKTRVVMDMDLSFLHGGKPKVERTATFHVKELPEPRILVPKDLTPHLKHVLSDFTVCSKEEPQVRIFDHQVQGSTVIPQLTGPNFDGPNDAVVYRPIPDCNGGWVISLDTDVRKSMKHFGLTVRAIVDNAVRKNVVHGGDPDRMTIFDNWCMANCKGDDEELGRLAVGMENFRECMLALGYDVPCDVGKDSMNNHYRNVETGEVFYIAPTLLTHCRSVIPDVRTAVTGFAKKPGNLVYSVGVTKPEMGGSIFYWLHDSSGEELPAGHDYYHISGYVGNDIPVIDMGKAARMYRALHKVVTTGIYPKEKIVRAAKAVSHGGLGVAAAQMAFGGGLGMELDLTRMHTEGDPKDWQALFSESLGRVLVEVPGERASEFEDRMGDYPVAHIGQVTNIPYLKIHGKRGRAIYGDIEEFREAWKAPLRG